MTNLFNWLAENESGLSAIAALIAIIAGLAVVTRLVWTRIPGEGLSHLKRPAFLSDWRNIGLICLAVFGLLLLSILTLSNSDSDKSSEASSEFNGKPSVAVLPLNNISGDPEQEYLADGIAEDVITLLSRNPRFFVIARNSSFTYKGKAVDIRQVGKELGVRYVVEGSLRKIADQLRVTVQLIDTSNGQHLWAEQYDRPFAEIFALQDEITNGIAVALGDEIFEAEIARANSVPTDNLDAWGLVMSADRAMLSFNSKSTLEAVELLRKALDLDPDFPLAKAELSRSLCWRAVNPFSEDPARAIAEAYALGKEVLQIAPNDPLVLYAVGACYGVTGRTEEAVRLLEKAVAKQPNFALALGALSYSLSFDGQAEKSVPYSELSLRLSPQSPLIWLLESWYAFGLNELGRHKEAEQALQKALKSYDGWTATWVHMAWARVGLGDIEGAKQALYNARKSETQFSLETFKRICAIAYRDKGANLFAALEPIWPEDLLINDEESQ